MISLHFPQYFHSNLEGQHLLSLLWASWKIADSARNLPGQYTCHLLGTYYVDVYHFDKITSMLYLRRWKLRLLK